MLNKECTYCKAAPTCSTACEYGSIMCMFKRLQCGQTKSDIPRVSDEQPRYCAHCGQPLKVIGTETFCDNVRCVNRYQNI